MRAAIEPGALGQGGHWALTPISANLKNSQFGNGASVLAHACDAGGDLRWPGGRQGSLLVQWRQAVQQARAAEGARRHFLCGRLAGGVAEMLRDQRLGQ